jgi:hypothetical protein
MSEYRRAIHRIVAQVLEALEPSFLERTGCCFGGGTRLALDLGEYRESQDIDFLCSDLSGYRLVRSGVSHDSLGPLVRKSRQRVALLREVRADQYGIRTVLAVGDQPVKFEIVLEARIDVRSARVKHIPVPVLDHTSCFAEKWLANADRWSDVSAMSRDAIDLAFMLGSWSLEEAKAGAALAMRAYGPVITETARAAAASLLSDARHRKECVRNLSVTDTRALAAGLRKLQKLAAAISSEKTRPAPRSGGRH